MENIRISTFNNSCSISSNRIAAAHKQWDRYLVPRFHRTYF